MANTDHLGVTLVDQSQSQKEVTVNAALLLLDALLNTGVIDKDLTAPPGSPASGDIYIVASGATGSWAGKDHQIAWYNQTWKFIAPNEGLTFWVRDEDLLYTYDGAAWELAFNPTSFANLTMLGINATADATNKLSVNSSAILFNHIGNGVQVKLNKNASGDTASFLYQTNWSGRAEIGLCGDDDFHFKVSDGTSWYDALVIDHTSGNLSCSLLKAGNLVLHDQGALISRELLADFPGNVWPMIWLTCNDSDPHAGGAGNPFCSITLENTSTTNKFGEIAFQKRVSGTPTDTWALAVDPDRVNVENLKLRHTGADVLEFAADNSQVRVFTNILLDGSIGKVLQSYNAAGTVKLNMMRVAGGDYIQYGHVSSALTGMQFYPGAGGLGLQFNGTNAEGWFPNRLGIGTGSSGGTAKLTVYGDGSDGMDGQTIRLGKNSSVDYSLRRNQSTGTLEFEGSQVGARGFKFMSGSLAVGASDANASAALDVQSTTQGALFPRMTTTQKNAISSPAEGLVVYDTTLHKLCVRTASAWETITSV